MNNNYRLKHEAEEEIRRILKRLITETGLRPRVEQADVIDVTQCDSPHKEWEVGIVVIALHSE